MKNQIKLLMTLSLIFILGACSSKPQGYEMPIAMSEVFRNGELKGLEYKDGPELGMPNQTDRVSHTCTSTPLYSLEGYYTRTVVHCQ